jgi:hypothetical protein|tara:strand:+ start:14848 stop:15027 length:180 start_codon:yes stop_codon:yes gene_type:complete
MFFDNRVSIRKPVKIGYSPATVIALRLLFPQAEDVTVPIFRDGKARSFLEQHKSGNLGN